MHRWSGLWWRRRKRRCARSESFGRSSRGESSARGGPWHAPPRERRDPCTRNPWKRAANANLRWECKQTGKTNERVSEETQYLMERNLQSYLIPKLVAQSIMTLYKTINYRHFCIRHSCAFSLPLFAAKKKINFGRFSIIMQSDLRC